ncbi:hypothetical protein FRB95_000417 [Tulasnella sp. JGI-2019a]|nr:hypothetical protein FRB95_000417 [Tulasnella sp. JGI-2019a]
MATPPPEIIVAIIDELTADVAYTFSMEVKATLRNLALIARLRATLSSTTPRSLSLASRIQALRLTASENESKKVDRDEHATWAADLLNLLAPPNATLKRLFMDMFLARSSLHERQPPDRSFNLQSIISAQTSLTELVLGNIEEWMGNFFWMIEISHRQYNCFSGLRALTILDVNVVHPPTRDVPVQFVKVEELVLIRPWITDPERGGEVLAKLFAPGRSLQSLIILLAKGWERLPRQRLKMDDLGIAMVQYRDRTLILPESDDQDSLPSWEEIRDMIGFGRRLGHRDTEHRIGHGLHSHLGAATSGQIWFRSPPTPCDY